MKILVASSNPMKVEWFKMSLDNLGMEILSLDDIGYSLKCEECGDSYKINSVIKAIEPLFALKNDEFIVVSDDGGVEVDGYYENDLGLYTHRNGKTPYELNCSILRELTSEYNSPWKLREVKFEGAESVAWYEDGKIHFRTVEGRSTDELYISKIPIEKLSKESNSIYDIIDVGDYYGPHTKLSDLDMAEQMSTTGVIKLQLTIRRWINHDILPSLLDE